MMLTPRVVNSIHLHVVALVHTFSLGYSTIIGDGVLVVLGLLLYPGSAVILG